MSGVVIRWLPSSARTSAAELWVALERRTKNWGLACSWDWTHVWLRHYGDLVPHRFAVGDVDGTPCAVALVTNGVGRRRGPFSVRSVHLGTAGEPPEESVFVEYNRVLVEPQHRRAFAAALMDELRRDRRWHELQLDGFESEAAEPLLLAEPLLAPRRVACPTVDLRSAASAQGDVLATLRSSTRRKVRRSLAVIGDVETEWAETPEHALDILSELSALHQRRWTSAGRSGVFSSRRFAEFHREVVPRLLPRRAVVLFRVRAQDHTVGCLYHFIERRRVLFYQSGFASYSERGISPGFVTHALCMQASLERGFSEYDLLAGDSRYKRELSTTTRELVWAIGRRPAYRWQTMDRVDALGRRMRAAARRRREDARIRGSHTSP